MPIKTVNLLCELLGELFKKSIVPFQPPGALDTLRFLGNCTSGKGVCSEIVS